MARKDLVDYVESSLKKGRHVRHVKRKLSHAGHPIHEIEDAVRHVILTKPHLKRRRHKIFAASFIALALLIFSVWLFSYEQLEEAENYKKDFTFSSMSDLQLLNYAIDHNTTEPCAYIGFYPGRYACMDRLWGGADWDSCMIEAYAGGDIKTCRWSEAMREKDLNLCYLLGNLSQDCRERLLKDAVASGELGDVCEASDCLIDAVLLMSDPSLCDTPEEDMYKNACRDFVARELDDSSVCEDITIASDRYSCMRTFLTDPAEVVGFCDAYAPAIADDLEMEERMENYRIRQEYLSNPPPENSSLGEPDYGKDFNIILAEYVGLPEDERDKRIAKADCAYQIFDDMHSHDLASCQEIKNNLERGGESFLNDFRIYLKMEPAFCDGLKTI